jgi:hypothetical protein
MHAYYALGGEQDRLAEGEGVVELERTKEILLRHLPDPPALAEAGRVVRPGGPVFVAAISRWAPRLAGELRLRLYEELPAIREETPRVERTGFIPPLFYQSFTGYCHRPGQLGAELRGAGLEVVDLVGVEGLAFALSDLEERLADPVGRAVVLDAARAIERVPELLGLGPHLLATARRPTG